MQEIKNPFVLTHPITDDKLLQSQLHKLFTELRIVLVIHKMTTKLNKRIWTSEGYILYDLETIKFYPISWARSTEKPFTLLIPGQILRVRNVPYIGVNVFIC